MTLIVSVVTPEVVVLLGDARISAAGGAKRHDCCQKVQRLSRDTLFAFTGSVDCHGEFLGSMYAASEMFGEDLYNKRMHIQQLVLTSTYRRNGIVDAFRRQDGSWSPITLVFAGRVTPIGKSPGVFQILHTSVPKLAIELVTQNGVRTFGTGAEYYKDFAEGMNRGLPSLREMAQMTDDFTHYFAIFIAEHAARGLQIKHARTVENAQQPDQSFGIILHGMYIDHKGIFPIQLSIPERRDQGASCLAANYCGGYSLNYKDGRFHVGLSGSPPVPLLSAFEFVTGQGPGPHFGRLDPHLLP